MSNYLFASPTDMAATIDDLIDDCLQRAAEITDYGPPETSQRWADLANQLTVSLAHLKAVVDAEAPPADLSVDTTRNRR